MMSEPYQISGQLDKKAEKRLTHLMHRGTVGPTAVYYAGVTAPIISASVSVMVRNAMQMVGLSAYWQWFLAALVAAFAGISWYLIFIRWSHRQRPGAATLNTEIVLGEACLQIRRGGIDTRIDWASVHSVKSHRGNVSALVKGGDPVIIPDAWFEDRAARKGFLERLKQKAGA